MKFRHWLSKVVLKKRVKLIVDLTLYLSSSYLMFKKFTDVAVSEWLAAHAFQQPMVAVYEVIAISLLFCALAAKAIMLVFEHFPPLKHETVEPGPISGCLARVNNEVVKHLDLLENRDLVGLTELHTQHDFMLNIGIVISSMADHISKSIRGVELGNKDLFISLYEFNSLDQSLVYVLHYPQNKDGISSRVISLDGDNSYSKYNCVVCVNSENTTSYQHNCKKNYQKGNSRRYSSVRHYIGCKIASQDTLYGFLNIEFHNNTVFVEEANMVDFMEEHVYPFKLLLEYQFYKRDFCEGLKKLEYTDT